MEFLYPEKPVRIYDASKVPPSYGFNVKKNGWRTEILAHENEKVELFNRHGKLISTAKEFDWQWIAKLFKAPFLLDGEVLGPRQKLSKSNTIVIWDAAFLGGRNLTKLSYIDRWKMLNTHACQLPPARNEKNFGTRLIAENEHTSLYLSEWYNISEYEKIFAELDANFDEGLVFKNPNSKLDWNRFATKERISQLKLLRPEMSPLSGSYKSNL